MQVKSSEKKVKSNVCENENESSVETGMIGGLFSTADAFPAKMDLNNHLVRNPSATFFMRAKGNAMERLGIFDNDLLIVDRSLSGKPNDKVIAIIEDELVIRQLKLVGERLTIQTVNPEDEECFELTSDISLSIWGVVKYVIHNMRD